MPDKTQYESFRPAAGVHEAASLFRVVSNPIRLQLLLTLLEGGEGDSADLARNLGGIDPALLYPHLKELSDRSLIARRSVSKQHSFSLAEAGLAVLDAYTAICRRLVQPAPENFHVEPLSVPPDEAEMIAAGPATACSKLRGVASLFLLAGHPVRLRILLLLAEAERDSARLGEAFGDYPQIRINKHLESLQRGGLVSSRHVGKSPCHSLTAAGMGLAEAIRATVVLSPIAPMPPDWSDRGGRHPSRIGPIDPGTPEGLSHLLGALADPLRLRIMNLLSVGESVCICHLLETLRVPRQAVLQTLKFIRGANLVREEREGVWAYYRPSEPTGDLYRGLASNTGSGLAAIELLEEDRRRFRNLAPCPPADPAGPGKSRGSARSLTGSDRRKPGQDPSRS